MFFLPPCPRFVYQLSGKYNTKVAPSPAKEEVKLLGLLRIQWNEFET
jgi:hypothetical protein